MVFDASALEGIKVEAARLNVEWHALAAVAEVESDGRPLWDGLCPIRIEGHYFDRRLSGQMRELARTKSLSHPRAGAVPNPERMADRYAKLEQMKAIDPRAAMESCSWGLGQVMGAHWAALGYADVQALADEATTSIAGQVRLMGRYISRNGLSDELRRKDWSEFARLYNGKNYRKNNYDVRMANAYSALINEERTSFSHSDSVSLLVRGILGQEVRAVKERLAELGFYSGLQDAYFDGGTEIAVMDFQRSLRLLVDGKVGKNTRAALLADSTKSTTIHGGRSLVSYVNQQATRNRRCTAHLEHELGAAVTVVFGARAQAQIYSGGQARKGTPGSRTGSIRHDDYGAGGRALDAWIVNTKGKRIIGVALAKLGQYWLAKKLGGVGLEMAGGGIHLDEWVIPPPGGGQYWIYPYLQGQPHAAQVQQMLVDGSRGAFPRLAARL